MNAHRLACWTSCALFVACLVPAHAADDDQRKLEGKWVVESFQYNGNAMDRLHDAIREFKDGKYSLTPKTGDAVEGTFKLDDTKTPKAIDLEVNGRTLKGIYEIEGDTLRLCYILSDGQRPTELASKPDSGTILVIHKRAK